MSEEPHSSEKSPTLLQNEKDGEEPQEELIDPMYKGFVKVEGMKVGGIGLFLLNVVVASAIPIVGFITCYLIRSSHCAKYGALVGLGITFIMYGFSVHPDYSKHMLDQAKNMENLDSMSQFVPEGIDHGTLLFLEFTANPYIASGIIGLGLYIIFRSVYRLYRVHKMENSMLRR